MTYDLVTLGEALLRLWVPPGERLEDASAYRVAVAGAEANVAMAVAQTGRRVAWVSRLPDSVLGRRAAREIAGFGVDISDVGWVSEGRMGTYFVELSVPPRPISVIYDRKCSTAGGIMPDDINWDIFEEARVVHLTGITLALSPEARATAMEAARRAHDAEAIVTFDVNYRSSLWMRSEAREAFLEICSMVSVVISTAEDARDVFGISGDPVDVAAAMVDLTGGGSAVVTSGASGAAWGGDLGSGWAPAHEAVVLDRIGAGDAFAAGVILGLIDGDLSQGVRRGLAMSAVKLGIYGDQLIYYPDEVAALLDGGSQRAVRR